MLEEDIAAFYDHQQDPTANHMAAFGAEDPSDLGVFIERWAKILGDERVGAQAILYESQIAGHIARFELFGKPQVTYWIDKQHWGKGIATAALRLFLVQIDSRPLYASAAVDNLDSLQVLAKCGFEVTGQETAFARGRAEKIEEAMLVLR